MSSSKENDISNNAQNDQDGRAVESYKRKLKEDSIFINTYHAELMEKENKKQRPTPQKNTDKEEEKEVSLSKIRNDDGLFLEGIDCSVGKIIKKKAVECYHSYYDNISTKSIITLGLNSILDLSYNYPDAQSTLFSNKNWTILRKIHKKEEHKTNAYSVGEKVSSILKEAELMLKKKNLPESSDHIYKYLYTHKKKITEDEEFVLYTHAFVLEFVNYNPYIFNPNIKKNEQDCLVKLWGPLMEKLVQKTNLRLKWGESTCSMINNSLRADLRVIHDNTQGQGQQQQQQQQEYDLMEIEVTRISPTRQKFDFDHAKVLVETKDNLDFLEEHVDRGLSCLQFCGLELYKYHLIHASDTLYINNKIDSSSIPPAIMDFEFLKELCCILINTKKEWINLQSKIIVANNTPRTAYPSSSVDKAPNRAKYKKSPSWYPPRPDQTTATLMPIPSNLE